MTDTAGSNTAAEGWDGHNVIAVSFADDGNAYEALTSLKQLDAQRRVGVREAVVVVRGQDGQLVEKDRVESRLPPAAAGGGLLGLLVGVLGGPLGVLVGGSYGLLAGSLVDLADVSEADSALAQISGSARLGHTALLAVLIERSPEVLDAAMAQLDGTVVRRSVPDVEAEIAAAESAERTAKREARKELIRTRHEHNKAAVQTKLEELKAKLHHGRQTQSHDADHAPTTTVARAEQRRRPHMDDMIVAVRFSDVGEARRAMHELKQLDRDGSLRVREAALLERSAQGRIGVPGEGQDEDGFFMPPGGIVGMLVEALGGPNGVLFQRPAEGFRGHGGPSPHDGERDVALEDIRRNLEPGVTLVVAEIADPDPDVLDSTLDALGGTVTRRAAQDVYAELQAAHEAESGK